LRKRDNEGSRAEDRGALDIKVIKNGIVMVFEWPYRDYFKEKKNKKKYFYN